MHPTRISLNRRRWLQASAAGVAAATLPTFPAMLSAQQATDRPHSPEEALRRLVEGNRRFMDGDNANLNRSMARVRELGAGQTPFASVLACADSRVPPEILFDQGLGDLFVTRIAGNIATSEVIGSLEFGAAVLGAQLIMVLGHTACGAVKATLEMGEVPGQIGSLFPYIHPAAEEVADETLGDGTPPLEPVIEQNVRHQMTILQMASPVLKGMIAAGNLQVAGGVYHFDSGMVEVLS